MMIKIILIAIFAPIIWVELPLWKEIRRRAEMRNPYKDWSFHKRILIYMMSCEFCLSAWIGFIWSLCIGELLWAVTLGSVLPFITAIIKSLYDNYVRFRG